MSSSIKFRGGTREYAQLYAADLKKTGADEDDIDEDEPMQRFNVIYVVFIIVLVISLGTIITIIAVSTASSSPTPAPEPSPTDAPTPPPTVLPTTAPPTSAPVANPTQGARLNLLPADVQTSFLCNMNFGNGTCRAVVHYTNTKTTAVTVPTGTNNYIVKHGLIGSQTVALNYGQPTVFQPGTHYGGASFLWPCSLVNPRVEWVLKTGPLLSKRTSKTEIVRAHHECPALPEPSS